MTSDGTNRPPRQNRSLRWRIRGWTAAVFGLTLAGFAVLGVLDERRRTLAAEAASGQALLGHLAKMPDFANLERARSHLDSVREPLRAMGADIDLVPAAAPPSGSSRVLVAEALRLAEGPHELRYRIDGSRLAEAARRSILVHAGLGFLTLLALLGGTEWILRRRLVGPLHQISHQVRHMKSGTGWLPVLPATDVEIAEVADAVAELGPALGAQVEQWLEGERRAAVAKALAQLRGRLQGPRRHALALLSDLQASDLVMPAGKTKVRALVLEIERLRQEIDLEEASRFAPLPRPDQPVGEAATISTDPVSGHAMPKKGGRTE